MGKMSTTSWAHPAKNIRYNAEYYLMRFWPRPWWNKSLLSVGMSTSFLQALKMPLATKKGHTRWKEHLDFIGSQSTLSATWLSVSLLDAWKTRPITLGYPLHLT